MKKNIQENLLALTDVAQLVGHWPAKQEVTNSIPSQGTCLGCGLVPSQGMYKRKPINISFPNWYFFPPLSPLLPSPSSKKKGGGGKKEKRKLLKSVRTDISKFLPGVIGFIYNRVWINSSLRASSKKVLVKGY